MSNRAERRAKERERKNYRRAMAAWYEREPPRWRVIAWFKWRARMPR